MIRLLLRPLALTGCLLGALLTSAFAAPPVIQNAGAVSDIEARNVRVFGQVAAVGESATWYFEYGLTTSYGLRTPTSPSVPSGTFLGLSTSLLNLTPNTTYNYRVRATSASGAVVTGPNRTFTTIAPVPVSIDPLISGPSLVAAGDDLTLGVTVNAGSDPLTYKWRRNGVLLRNSTGRSSAPNYVEDADWRRLRVSNITGAMAGTYTCEVSNPDSTAQTTSAFAVSVASISPALDFTKKEGETFSFTATVTPANPAATYSWQADNAPTMTGYGTVSGLTSPTLTVAGATPAAEDDYWCRVTLGTESVETAQIQVSILPKPVIDPISDLTVAVSEPVSIDVQVSDATSVRVSGLPLGLTFNPRTRVISGKPLSPTGLDEPAVVVVNANNVAGAAQPEAFTITVNPFDADMQGSFDGLVSRGADSNGIGGQISFTVTPTGLVTGTLLLDVGRYPFRSQFDVDSGGTSARLTLPNLRSGRLPVVNSLFINLADDGTFSGSVARGTLTGFLTDGARNPWAAHNPFVTAGVFNCSLTPSSSALLDPAIPHGYSYVALTVSNVGAVSFLGKTSDGLQITGKSSVSAAGVIPLFAVQSGGKASLQGTPTITGRDVAGSCDWKSVGRSGRVYPTGFQFHNLTVLGRRYVRPAAGLNQILLGLSNTALNARIEFSDGGLGSTVAHTFTLTGLNVPLLPAGTTNPNAVTMRVNPATGVIEGTFSVTAPNPLNTAQNLTRTATYSGLVIPGTGEARGFFTLAKLPSAGPPASNTSIRTSDMLSGITVLKAP